MLFLFDSLVSGVAKGFSRSFDPATLHDLGAKYLGETELGSIPGLLGRLQDGGLGVEVDSWLGPGANLPVLPVQLRSGVGERAMSQLAKVTGVSVDQLLVYMADLLPTAIERMHADGILETQPAAPVAAARA